MHGLIETILTELRGAWRFRRHALVVAWAVCVAGWLVVYLIPDQYQAYARVNVDTRTALRPLLEGIAVSQDVEAKLNLMKQQLLGRVQELAAGLGVLGPEAPGGGRRRHDPTLPRPTGRC